MIWTTFLIVALSLFAAGVVAAAFIAKHTTRVSKFLTPFNTVFVGAFLMTFVLMLPVYYEMCRGADDPVVKTILFTMQGTFQIFTVDADSSLILEYVNASIGAVASVYSVLLSVLFVVAPILTFGFVMLFFEKTAVWMRLLFIRFKDVYAFSELNERSIAFASDLRNKHPKAVIIFTSVPDEENELTEKADRIRAVCCQQEITALKLKNHSRSKVMYLFMIGSDEHRNVNQAMELIKSCGQVENSFLYVFSVMTVSELLLSHSEQLAMKVFRVNDIRSMIYNDFYENGQKLFDGVTPTKNGDKTIHAVIVGLGRYGTELLKTLVWYCQMPGYRFEVDVYDKDKLAKSKFTAQCPELMSPDHNGKYIPGDAFYTIRIHSGTDTDSMYFADSIRQMKDVTCAYAACGTDEENIRVAVNMRILFERMGAKPAIRAIVYDTDMKEALTKAVDFKENLYNIDCFGDLEQTYSEAVIMNSELEAEALRQHLKWKKDADSFWRYEYNYRSSMATALHLKAKIDVGIKGIDKPKEERTPEEQTDLSSLEHCRWNAYMRSEGYVRGGSKKTKDKDMLGKRHFDLVPFNFLDADEVPKDERVGSK